MTTRTIFCKLFDNNNPIAVFVDEKWSYRPEDEGIVNSYEHVGQHGAFSLRFFDRRTNSSHYCKILDNPEDYQNLLDELVNIGYNDLVVITAYKRIKKNESLG